MKELPGLNIKHSSFAGFAVSVAALSGIAVKSLKVVKNVHGPVEKETLLKEIIDVQIIITEVEQVHFICEDPTTEDYTLLEIKNNLQRETERLDAVLDEILERGLIVGPFIKRRSLTKPIQARLCNELRQIRKDLVLVLEAHVSVEVSTDRVRHH
ncbi:MAG: hypothetical protein Q9181_001859 [Wetmoreana brouardii]